jgi:WhiB family redox-sensing transcriptional regulator
VNGTESGSVVLGSEGHGAQRSWTPQAGHGSGGELRDVLSELAMVTEDEQEWQERALCAQTDPEAFFPEKGGSTREAKQICNSCEVRTECLEYALGHDERFGIWGGLSERERRRLKRRAV